MSQPINLDLNFRTVSPERQVFVAFPGKGYRLYRHFANNSFIWPELPALGLPYGKNVDEVENLLPRLARSRRLNRWYRSNKQSEMPSRQLADYSRVDQGLYHLKGVVQGFFSRAKKYDLVVVPPADLFGEVLIGELQDEPTEFTDLYIPELYEQDEVPARKVKWLAKKNKTGLSLGMLRRFPKPNPFTVLDREFYQEIFSVAYGSYALDDMYTSRFEVTQADFRTIDDYKLQQVINAVAAMCQVVESKSGSVGPDCGWDDIIELLSDDSYIPELSVNINSPGSLILTCKKVVPLVVASILALATLDAQQTWSAAEANEIRITNSAIPNAGDDLCTAKVAEETLDQIRMMGFQRWQRLCKKITEVKESTGLTEQSEAK